MPSPIMRPDERSMPKMRSLRTTTMTMLVAILLTGCGGGGGDAASDSAAAVVAISVTPDHVTIVDSGLVESGPSLSGTLDAKQVAQLRAQVAGTVVQMYVNEGAAVSAGQALARIDATVLTDQARSAASQLQSAEAAATVATRNAERAATLHGAGAIAQRDLEAARSQAIAADAMAADARSRLASARKQLANATIRAPFSGVVSERPASEGDVVQMGTPIVTVIDASALELAASVPASALGSLRRGAKVEFTVTGYPDRRFTGTIARVNPAVDPVTRQVRIYAEVPNGDRSLAAGVFAEGRVAFTQVRALTIPLSALDPQALAPSVKRLRGGVIEEVPVTLGLRDDVAERIEVKSGVQLGDTLLVGGAMGTPVGSVLRVARPDR